MTDTLQLYRRSADFLWTDSHIAQNMLKAHLDPQTDGASRNPHSIEKTVEWLETLLPAKSSVIDFGCGPGLYAEKLASLGYSLTGVDISENSIRYAEKSAREKGLPITYCTASYLDTADYGMFDAALCIYCDFGALVPEEQKTFLRNVRSCLKPNGMFIFDVFSEGINAAKTEGRSWTYNNSSDFMSACAHYTLTEFVHFKTERVWGQRTILIDEKTGALKEYITWDNYYTELSITELLAQNGFSAEKIERSIVTENNFTADDVLFVKARKL